MCGRDSHDDRQRSSYSNAVRNPHRWERPKQHVRSFERKNGRKRVHGTVFFLFFLGGKKIFIVSKQKNRQKIQKIDIYNIHKLYTK